MKIYSDKLVDTKKFEEMHDQQQAEINQLRADVKHHRNALLILAGLELICFILIFLGLK